jgi:hypothetical protein
MRYYAKVVRLRLEVACVEIEGDDIKTGQHAADRALDMASNGALDWKLQPFDAEAYGPHVEMLLSDPEIDGDEPEADAVRRWMCSPETAVNDRYLLLHADTDTGEGRTILQPWLSEAAGLMLADLCGEWMDDLADLSEIAIEPVRTGRGSATIIPFRPRSQLDDGGGPSLT